MESIFFYIMTNPDWSGKYKYGSQVGEWKYWDENGDEFLGEYTLDGVIYTLKELQQAAIEQKFEFVEYMTSLKSQGLKKMYR